MSDFVAANRNDPDSNRRSRRLVFGAGFTLVELLVVIAIIGMLVALLLPAIQSAREAGRRTQCLNKFKQVGIAMQNHHSAKGEFPVGWKHAEYDCGLDFFSEDFGWSAFILPYLEQQQIYDNLIFGGKFPNRMKDKSNAGLHQAGAVIQDYLCPSERQYDIRVEGVTGRAGMPDHGRTNMVGIVDAFDWTCSRRLGKDSRFPDPEGNGILRGWVATKIKDITDGTSHTMIVGEATGYTDGSSRGFRWAAVNSVDVSDGINGGRTQPGRSIFWWGPDGGLSSFHPGGCIISLADGSSRYVSQDIDQAMLERLAGRNDGEAVEIP